MPGICRLNDRDSGHMPAFPGRQNNKASQDTFVDNKGVHRKTDTWIQHCCPNNGCHSSTTVTASTTVFANKLGVARIGDFLDCGGKIIQGSSTVIIG